LAHPIHQGGHRHPGERKNVSPWWTDIEPCACPSGHSDRGTQERHRSSEGPTRRWAEDETVSDRCHPVVRHSQKIPDRPTNEARRFLCKRSNGQAMSRAVQEGATIIRSRARWSRQEEPMEVPVSDRRKTALPDSSKSQPPSMAGEAGN